MSIDTSKLRALAEAATPGPWTAFMGGQGSYVYHRPTATEVCAFTSHPDAEFIAGVDPAVILALCDEFAALTDRPADEQIAEWQEDVNCDPASVAGPILAALVAERERADKAERQVATLVDQLKDYGLHARWTEPS